jgi:D-alanine-D-alanine ligase-like ATP-grasp enzyme
MSNTENTKPFLVSILGEVCSDIGATLYAEPQYGYAGYVEFRSGKRRFFRGASFDINGQSASSIATDKNYCSHFLSNAGFTVPEEILVFSPAYRAEIKLKNPAVAESLSNMQKAIDFTGKFGFPVFVKPNEGSKGLGVHKVYSIDELFDALLALFPDHPRVLIQRPVSGRDYRVVVLKDEVISAYERVPFGVTGDGVRTLRDLTELRIRSLSSQGKGAKTSIADPRIVQYLHGQQLNFDAVVEAGKFVELLPNANLSSGGHAVDISDELSPALAEVCIAATQAVGLNFAGVDLLCADATAEAAEYTILEVNSAPGLNNFSALGEDQDKKVKYLYRRILDYMENHT